MKKRTTFLFNLWIIFNEIESILEIIHWRRVRIKMFRLAFNWRNACWENSLSDAMLVYSCLNSQTKQEENESEKRALFYRGICWQTEKLIDLSLFFFCFLLSFFVSLFVAVAFVHFWNANKHRSLSHSEICCWVFVRRSFANEGKLFINFIIVHILFVTLHFSVDFLSLFLIHSLCVDACIETQVNNDQESCEILTWFLIKNGSIFPPFQIQTNFIFVQFDYSETKEEKLFATSADKKYLIELAGIQFMLGSWSCGKWCNSLSEHVASLAVLTRFAHKQRRQW